MIEEIKKLLLENPKYIVTILEKYDFYNIKLATREITCAFYEGGSAKSIHIKLLNNEYLFVNDYARDIHADLINYIIKSRDAEFKEVITYIKSILGLTGAYCSSDTKVGVFGGFYDKIKRQRNKENNNKILDDSILERYIDSVSMRFINDNISAATQKFFNVRYDIESQRIIFPVYDWQGNIIGIKGRANWDISEDEPKYLYLVPCNMLGTLYGYWQNYKYMIDDTVIVVESEKSVMQAYEYGNRNIIALGRNSISAQQCRLIMMLNPSKVIFANDEGLDLGITKKNINTLKLFTRMKDTEICYWDYRKSSCVNIGSHDSITDNGKEIMEEILENEIYNWGDLDVEC